MIQKNMYRFSKYLLIYFVSAILLTLISSPSFAQSLTINLVAVNGSEEPKKTPVKYYLPMELKPEDVTSAGDLKVEYDLEKESYFVYGDFELAPKESRTFKLQIKDVWKIDVSEIEVLKQQINNNLSELDDTEYYESATTLRDNLFQKLDYILQRQEEFQNNIERRIEEYRANIDIFNELKRDAFSSTYLISSPSISESENDTVKMIIEVKNPSMEEAKTISYKHYLPKEIRSSHLVDSQGFDVRFDAGRGQSYLSKEEEFQPGEKKRYIIVLKDAWSIPKSLMNSIYKRTNDSLKEIFEESGNEEIAKTANFLSENIFSNIKTIQESQSKEASVKEHIGIFRANKARYDEADESLKQLERLLAVISVKKLQKYQGLAKSQVKNVLKQIKALRGVAALSKALLGKRPSITNTWRIIWAVMAFIALFTSIHFFTWRQRSKFMGEEHSAESGGEFEQIVQGGEDEEDEKKKKK